MSLAKSPKSWYDVPLGGFRKVALTQCIRLHFQCAFQIQTCDICTSEPRILGSSVTLLHSFFFLTKAPSATPLHPKPKGKKCVTHTYLASLFDYSFVPSWHESVVCHSNQFLALCSNHVLLVWLGNSFYSRYISMSPSSFFFATGLKHCYHRLSTLRILPQVFVKLPSLTLEFCMVLLSKVCSVFFFFCHVSAHPLQL